MKNAIFKLLKVGMITTFVGLTGYIVYLYINPGKKSNESHDDGNIHTMKKAG